MMIKLKYELREKHVHTRIFMGESEEQLTLCGNLMFNKAEFDIFKRCLEDSGLLNPSVKVITIDATGGSSSSFPRVEPPKK